MNEEYLNATCSICGKRYHKCVTCKSEQAFFPWKSVADSANCWKIYYHLSNFTKGVCSVDETHKQLENCDLSELDSFQDHIKRKIKEILTKVEKQPQIKKVSAVKPRAIESSK